MAAATTRSLLTSDQRAEFFKADAAVGDAENRRWMKSAVTLREHVRRNIDVNGADATAVRLVAELLAGAVDGTQRAAVGRLVSKNGQPSTLKSYWSEINQAEKNTGAKAKADYRAGTVTFAADGKIYTVSTRKEVQALNKVLNSKNPTPGKAEHSGQIWTAVEANGTVTLESKPVPAPTQPAAPTSGSQTAPVKSAEEEARETLVGLPKSLTKALKGPDGKFYPRSEKELGQLVEMAGQLVEAINSQDQSVTLTNKSIKILIGVAHAVAANQQVKAAVAK